MLKISIVTAVYNRVGTIAQSIESVKAQTYPHVEHVIQDGSSSDGTLDVVRSMATKDTKVESRPDLGIYDAINRGLRRSTGDVVGVMHSDDFFPDEHVLSKIAERFDEPNIDGVYGDLDYVSSSDPGKVIRRWRSGQYSLKKIKWGWMPPHPTLYLRRNVFENLGYYNTDYSIAADYEAMLRYMLLGQIRMVYIPEVLVKMRVGGESNRSLSKIIKKSGEDFRAIKDHKVGGLSVLFMKNIRKIHQFM